MIISSSVCANTWHSAEIQRIYPLANGDFVISFKSDAPDCTNPNTPKYHYVSSGQGGLSPEGRDKIYSLVLTAATSGKSVSINFDKNDNNCYVNRALINF
ncbi:response regulator receiver protein [Aliikangiella marina]|uniref:Response regulator receiver protein n=2 Tax=Aliikangiella marina TaxID=1712262 RepID=A0A545TEI3_9GAMM|nr:response regulator receiver protein [Aliikangiella marina]